MVEYDSDSKTLVANKAQRLLSNFVFFAMNKLRDIFLRFLGGELSRSSPGWVAGTVGSVVPTRISPCAGAHVRGRPARMRRCRCRVRGVRTSFFLLGINRLRASCLNAFCESTEKAQTGALSQNPSIGIPLGVTLCGGIHKPPSISLYSEAVPDTFLSIGSLSLNGTGSDYTVL